MLMIHHGRRRLVKAGKKRTTRKKKKKCPRSFNFSVSELINQVVTQVVTRRERILLTPIEDKLELLWQGNVEEDNFASLANVESSRPGFSRSLELQRLFDDAFCQGK